MNTFQRVAILEVYNWAHPPLLLRRCLSISESTSTITPVKRRHRYRSSVWRNQDRDQMFFGATLTRFFGITEPSMHLESHAYEADEATHVRNNR